MNRLYRPQREGKMVYHDCLLAVAVSLHMRYPTIVRRLSHASAMQELKITDMHLLSASATCLARSHQIHPTQVITKSSHIPRTQPSKSIRTLPSQILKINALIANMSNALRSHSLRRACGHERIHVLLHGHRHAPLWW